MSSEVLAALGEQAEFSGGGQRVILPESYFPVSLTVEETGVTEEKEDFVAGVVDVDGNQVPIGGSPFVQLACEVTGGPFEGHGFSARQFLTPGKKAGYIAFINSAIKAVTGKPANIGVFGEFGMEFPADVKRDQARQMLRTYFYSMDPDRRLDFMTKYARIAEWDGRKCVAKIGQELGQERTDEATGAAYAPVFNRYQGFYAISDKDHGAAWVTAHCFDKQKEAAVEAGITAAA
jgi:hypothetical protein